jgi:hypothetical protein
MSWLSRIQRNITLYILVSIANLKLRLLHMLFQA